MPYALVRHGPDSPSPGDYQCQRQKRLAELARLTGAGVEVYSTGGTRRFLLEHGCQARGGVHRVSGDDARRVKTLHQNFGGILCRRDHAEDIAATSDHGIVLFRSGRREPVSVSADDCQSGVTPAEAIENIDIGGPSLVRAAAKNHAFTAIATEPGRYPAIVAELKASGGTSLAARQKLAAAAFAHTAAYDSAIANWFGRVQPEFSADAAAWREETDGAAVWRKRPPARSGLCRSGGSRRGLITAKQLNGKELSYNNLLDLDNAAGRRALRSMGLRRQ